MPSFADNKKIAKNTIALYIRMVVMLVVSFLTCRIVLQALGIVDYGINNVVGGIVFLLSLVNTSMSLSVQRFLSFEIGKRDQALLNRTFNTAVIIHLVLGVIVLLLGETVGLYCLTHYINFPPERATAVMWVYQMALLGSFLGILQVPYTAIVMAYEKMTIYAYFTVADVVIRILLVFLLLYLPGDKLIIYSIFGAAAGLTIFCAYRLYFHIQFNHLRFYFSFDKNKLKSLSVFAGWSTFGELAWAGTNQGVTILLNLFFGPAINGVRGIANQVQSVVMRFIASYQTAMQPQIVKLYAADEIENMKKLVYRGTCFSYYLALFFALPIILEPHFLLELWLGTVPEYLTLFSQLVLINVLLDMLTNLLASAAKAYGKIGKYQATVSIVLAMNFILSYIVLSMGMPAYSVFIVYSFVSLLLIVVRVYLLRSMIPEMTVTLFLKNVIYTIASVTIIAISIPILSCYIIPACYGKSFIICSISALSVMATVWTIGLNHVEREKLKQTIRSFIHRFRHEH
ncbi:MAG: lipopolysaccharide biosynthesis protein [Akkermansiaceae bacterium]|nr:lipopolysaccharide biosynthesis protein [Akkermansiaceae bacterium]